MRGKEHTQTTGGLQLQSTTIPRRFQGRNSILEKESALARINNLAYRLGFLRGEGVKK